jgi:hypothetical protein
MPGNFAFAVTRADQNTTCTNAMCQLDIAVTVSDHKGAPQIKSMFVSGALKHAWLRFAAIAAVSAAVRAIVNRVNARVPGGELLSHAFMNSTDQGFGKITTANAGLIRNHYDRQFCVIQATNRASGKREHMKTTDMIQVTHFFGDRSVAIDKYGGTEGIGIRQNTPPQSEAKVVPQRLPLRA